MKSKKKIKEIRNYLLLTCDYNICIRWFIGLYHSKNYTEYILTNQSFVYYITFSVKTCISDNKYSPYSI
jgi:hypothetical protein